MIKKIISTCSNIEFLLSIPKFQIVIEILLYLEVDNIVCKMLFSHNYRDKARRH